MYPIIFYLISLIYSLPSIKAGHFVKTVQPVQLNDPTIFIPVGKPELVEWVLGSRVSESGLYQICMLA